MLLFDTCTLLWIASDPEKISANAHHAILENADELYISAISAFEIGLKAQRGKLVLPFAPRKWFDAAIEHHGIREIPISSRICFLSAELPLHHNDPCDRFIIATAMLHSMRIVTADVSIARYKEASVIW